MSALPAPAPAEAKGRRAPGYFVFSAWAIPILILGQFAMLAIIPVSLMIFGILRDVRLRSLRWRTGLLAALYATPLTIWLMRSDGAQSLSKDMHPVFIVLIVAASALALIKIYTRSPND